MNENINFFLNESDDFESETDLSLILNNLDNLDNFTSDEYDIESIKLSKVVDYQMNYTVKQLFVICEYYGIKNLKTKCNKDEIISILVDFECDYANEEVVSKRRNMWFYINELKTDKFMKKYIIW
jgi:hypothetical protein